MWGCAADLEWGRPPPPTPSTQADQWLRGLWSFPASDLSGSVVALTPRGSTLHVTTQQSIILSNERDSANALLYPPSSQTQTCSSDSTTDTLSVPKPHYLCCPSSLRRQTKHLWFVIRLCCDMIWWCEKIPIAYVPSVSRSSWLMCCCQYRVNIGWGKRKITSLRCETTQSMSVHQPVRSQKWSMAEIWTLIWTDQKLHSEAKSCPNRYTFSYLITLMSSTVSHLCLWKQSRQVQVPVLQKREACEILPWGITRILFVFPPTELSAGKT